MSRIAAFASFAILLSQASASIFKRDDSTTSVGNNDITISGNGNTCPNGWENYISNNQAKCCPGAVYNEDDNTNNEDSAYCCVGATYSVARPTFSSCFPFCTSTASDDSNGVSVIQTSKQPCSATVFLTDADYSSKVSSASSSISGGSGAMTTDGSGSTGSSSGDAAAATGSSSTSSGGAAIMTSGPLAGALMVAGGLLFV